MTAQIQHCGAAVVSVYKRMNCDARLYKGTASRPGKQKIISKTDTKNVANTPYFLLLVSFRINCNSEYPILFAMRSFGQGRAEMHTIHAIIGH